MSVSQFLNQEFVSSTTQTKEFRNFARSYKKALKQNLPDGIKIAAFNTNHFCISGFVTDGEKYVYFSVSDVRFFPNEWYHHILIRTAKDTSDYTGGMNQYTTLKDFGRKVQRLLK